MAIKDKYRYIIAAILLIIALTLPLTAKLFETEEPQPNRSTYLGQIKSIESYSAIKDRI